MDIPIFSLYVFPFSSCFSSSVTRRIEKVAAAGSTVSFQCTVDSEENAIWVKHSDDPDESRFLAHGDKPFDGTISNEKYRLECVCVCLCVCVCVCACA